MTHDTDLTLYIPEEAYQKLMWYVKAVDTEITGFADVTYNKDLKRFEVGEVYLIKQEATGGDVEMHEESVSNFTLEMMKKKVKVMPRLWWHSHVDMGAFFSGTDHEAIESDILKNDKYLVALVINKRHEMKAVLRMWEPVDVKIELEIVKEPLRQFVPKAIIDEVAEKVEKKKFQLPSGNTWRPKKQRHEQGSFNGFKGSDKYFNGHNVTRCPERYPDCETCVDYLESVKRRMDKKIKRGRHFN